MKRQWAQDGNSEAKRRRTVLQSVEDETPQDDFRPDRNNCFKITSDSEMEEAVTCQRSRSLIGYRLRISV